MVAKAACPTTQPLGSPVLPDVNRQYAGEVRPGYTGFDPAPSDHSCSCLSPTAITDIPASRRTPNCLLQANATRAFVWRKMLERRSDGMLGSMGTNAAPHLLTASMATIAQTDLWKLRG